MLTSPVAATRAGAEAEIRRNLLLGGWVRAVVALPGKMLPQTSIAPVLWVLSKSESSARSSVLLIDASKVDTPEDEVSGWLTDESLLVNVPHARVSIDELAAGKADLNPARWTLADEIDGARLAGEYDRAAARLTSTLTALPTAVGHVDPPRLSGKTPVMTVSELLGAGVMEVAAARPPRQGAPAFENRRVDAAAVGTGELAPVAPVAHDEHGALTLPGDVLLTTIDKVRAIVDEDGGRFPVGSVSRIRVVDHSKLDPHYLADVLAGEWNRRFAAGAGIKRIPIREIEIPVPPLEEQRAIHDVIHRMHEAQRLAKQASEAADNLAIALLNAVRHGVTVTSKTPEGSTR